MEYHFHNFWRMDWGLDNPNKTAALIAMLMISVWALAYIRKWGFWLALTLFTGLGICLIHTYSRGGVIGCFAGLILVLVNLPRPWPRIKIAATVLSVWLMIGSSIYLQAHERFGQGVFKEDRSITNRLEIWKAAPKMMVDAPAGWGLGNSGQAFMQWYQPLNRYEAYRTLVNSHLTWLVEFGWPLRFLYVLGWFAVFAVCRPSAAHRWLAIPLGIWIAFAITAVFSSVAESPWLWILPGLGLLPVLIFRFARKSWPGKYAWLAPIGAAALVNLGFFIMGHHGMDIRKSGNLVVVGKQAPDLWLVVDTKTIGSQYGRNLRKFLSAHGDAQESIACVNSLDALHEWGGKTVILAGAVPDKEKKELHGIFATAGKLILLNPAFFPQEVDFNKSKPVAVLFGEFSQSPALQAWKDLGVAQNIEGKGDFLENWPELVLNPTPQP